jgi:FixJ family two-component response regulator
MASGDQRPVVIVEDDPSMRQALRRILHVAGYLPLAFESAEALIEDGSAAAAACLILDVQLPGMTGFELRRRLSGEGAPVPVIFITAYDEPEARLQASEAGAVAYLTKPFAGHALIDAVTRAHGALPPRGRRWRNGHT